MESKRQSESIETDSSISNFLGENYEYIRTIVYNTIEIKKIEFLDKGSDWVEKLIVGVLISIVIFLLSAVLLVMIAFLINRQINDWVLTCGILAGALLVIAVILHYFIRKLLRRVISRRMLELID